MLPLDGLTLLLTSIIYSVYFLPFLLLYALYKTYLRYIRADWIHKVDWVFLEIKVPREVNKSPAAMEVILSGLHQTSEGSLVDRYIKGRVRSWFSLELVSLGGVVHFYIRAERKYKNMIESQVYSQYPGVELFEVDDYVQAMPYGQPDADWEMWGVEFKFTQPDPYPIKTYVDYGLDKDPKEEFKIDPMTPMLEFLGSIGPGEQLWFQFLIMATKERYPKPGHWFKMQDWREEGKALIKKIMEEKAGASKDETNPLFTSEFSLTAGERDVIKAIDRSISKYGFDCGIRAMYFGKGEAFQGINIPRLLSSLKQYGSLNLNGFKPLLTTSFDYPWQDYSGVRLARRKRRMFKAYIRRGYFYPPFLRPPLVLNTEELATMYHIPGQVAETPTLSRIESKRGEPPPNLPI